MNYQIEIPDDWNGRLVVYIRGNDSNPELQVNPPPNRAYLIRNGYAWAASSFTVNIVVVAGQAADDSAALWDYFAQKYGRPTYSYVTGVSMGGAATMTSAERYPDRYDGALAMCGDALPATYTGDFFVIAAFAAGITQADYDTQDFGALVERAHAAIDNDPEVRKLYEDIWIDQTSGPRPFDRVGLRNDEDYAFETFTGNIPAGFWSNEGRAYELGPTAGVTSEAFNAGVIRVPPGAGSIYARATSSTATCRCRRSRCKARGTWGRRTTRSSGYRSGSMRPARATSSSRARSAMPGTAATQGSRCRRCSADSTTWWHGSRAGRRLPVRTLPATSLRRGARSPCIHGLATTARTR
jgi:pimeloyl-ACP methyl ester carboxylesterase